MPRRPLAPHEAALHAGDIRAVMCTHLTGSLDTDALQHAARATLHAYPSLAGQITTGPGGPEIHVPETASPPGRILLRTSASFHDEINAVLDWSDGPLLRVGHIPSADTHQVVLSVPRAYVDAMGFLAVHRVFWAHYKAAHHGDTSLPAPVQPVLPQALDDRLTATCSPDDIRAYVDRRAAADATAPPAVLPPLAMRDGGPGPERDLRISTVEVPPPLRDVLRRAAKNAGTSLNFLLSAALLQGLRAVLDPHDGPLTMRGTIAVDMRRRSTPPIPDEVLMSAASTASAALDITGSGDLTALAQSLAGQVRASIDRKEAALELAAFPYVLNQQAPSMVITNLGTIPPLSLPGSTRITCVHSAALQHIPVLLAVITTYDDATRIGFPYSRACYTDQQMSGLTSAVVRVLQRAAGQ